MEPGCPWPRGTYIMSLENPDLYAAQLNLCSADVYPDSQVAELLTNPSGLSLPPMMLIVPRIRDI